MPAPTPSSTSAPASVSASASASASAASYFHRVHQATPTRLWINNPTPEEARRGLTLDARSCTTNPAYSARIVKLLPEHERQDLLAAASAAQRDADAAVDHIQRTLVARLLPIFAPSQQPGLPYAGLVSIQGNPHRDTDSDHILHEAEAYAQLGPNVIFKIPATQAGLVAIEDLLSRGKPVLATEMMSVAQVLALCAIYRRVVAGSSRRPVLILTHITGIYDQYLGEQAKRGAPALPAAVVAEAGTMVARRAAAVLAEQDLPIGIMGGGARSLRHFTELVGGPYQVTINPDTIDTLVARDEPVTARFNTPIDPAHIELLRQHLPDFRMAWDDDGMRPEDFEHFGPIRLFLGMFITGWDQVKAQLPQRQHAQPGL